MPEVQMSPVWFYRLWSLYVLQECLVSGVGNWLADEVLYQARIHPEQPVYDLSDEMIGDLHSYLKKVIGLAVEVDSDSTRFPKDWLFHFRYVLIYRYFSNTFIYFSNSL